MTSSSNGKAEVGVSLIVTVRNDRPGLAELLRSLASQTRPPDEIVVVDGGSTDGTKEELAHSDPGAPVRLIVSPGANIAAGRNIAVRAARHDWLVCTDAGCRPDPSWVAELAHARERADLAAGVFVVDGDSPFERAVACAHHPSIDDLRDPTPLVRLSHRLFRRDFRPNAASARSMAFSRNAWKAVGGFPERVVAGEDLAFSAAVAARGFRTVLVEEAVVRWRPRATWLESARAFRGYGRGTVRVDRPARHIVRLTAWAIAPPLALAAGGRGRALLAVGALAYIWLPFRRAHRSQLPLREWWRIPPLVALKDFAQMVGSVEGFVDELRAERQLGRDSRKR